MIPILTAAFLLVLFWPVWKRHMTPVFDGYYRLRMEYRGLKGKRKLLKLFSIKLSPHLPKGVVYRIDRLQRLAGRPWKLGPAELILLELLAAAGLFVLSFGIQNAKVQLYILIGLVLIWPFTKLQNLAKKRRLEAREATRFLKRRLRQELHRGIPLSDALLDVGKLLSGEFGDTYRRLIAQIGERPLRDVMRELRTEYEVPELDALCTAVEYSDRQSPKVLVDMLDRQIREEAYRLDELIEVRTEAAKPKMTGMVALSVLWTMVLGGYFAYLALHDRAVNEGSIFFGL